MPDVFEFTFSTQDFIEKVLRDYREQLAPEMRKVLSDFGSNEQANDDDLIAFLEEDSFAPAIGVTRAATQSIPNNSTTTIEFDTQAFLSTEVLVWENTTQVLAQTAGIVLAVGTIEFAANGTGVRSGQFRVNSITNTQSVGLTNLGASFPTVVNQSRGFSVLAGDYLEYRAYQNSGGALDATATLEVIWLGSSG